MMEPTRKTVRRMPATDLRVHLGEALRRLDDEEIVVEKGGVPVARLIKYRHSGTEAGSEEVDMMYESAVGKKAEAGTWAVAEAAMNRGWVGLNAAKLTNDIRKWREEGTKPSYALDDEDEDGGEVSDRQRYLYQRDAQARNRVAEEPDEPYRA